MATLSNNDLFIVQRPAGGDAGTYKIDWAAIVDNIAASPAITFKGSANFTAPGEDPAPADNGDLYVNTTDGTFAWANPEVTNKAVSVGDYCLWDADDGVWRFIGNIGADGGVTSVDASAPLSMNGGATEGDVVVESREATETDSGHVARLATDAEVASDGAGGESAVVTADQLRATNIAVEAAAGGGITNVTPVQDPTPAARWNDTYQGSSYDPTSLTTALALVSPDNTGTARTLAVTLADTAVPGAILAPVAADVNPDSANTDVDGGLSKVHAVTPNLVYQYYTPRNFNLLDELP